MYTPLVAEQIQRLFTVSRKWGVSRNISDKDLRAMIDVVMTQTNHSLINIKVMGLEAFEKTIEDNLYKLLLSPPRHLTIRIPTYAPAPPPPPPLPPVTAFETTNVKPKTRMCWCFR